MNIFGWKKKQSAPAPAPAATTASATNPTVSIAKLRETIQQQEKRYVVPWGTTSGTRLLILRDSSFQTTMFTYILVLSFFSSSTDIDAQ